MPEGSGTPGGKPPGGGKRPAIGLQIKLPCASIDEVKARYGEDLKANRFFIRTKSARPKDTLVRLEVQLNTGTPAFRAAAVVMETTEAGMLLHLLGADEAGRELIASLGGKPPAALKPEPARPATPAPHSKPDIVSMPGIKPPPPLEKPVSAPPAAKPPEKPVSAPPAPKAAPPEKSVPAPPAAKAPPEPAAAEAAAPKEPEKAPATKPAPEPPKKSPMIGIDLGT